MKRILVLGGTRYFGRELVKCFIEKGYDITVATRGNSDDGFGDRIKRLKLDRDDKESLKNALAGKYFDIVYDNIAYSPNNVYELLDIIKDNCGKYILTSSGSVYEDPNDAKEENFNPYDYKISYGTRTDFDYAEGKRLAEAVAFQNFKVPAVAVRFPIVLGENDYTKRLYFYVEKIVKGEPIHVDNLQSDFCFINAKSAGGFLAYLGEDEFTGPINACDKGTIKIEEIITYIEDMANKKAIIDSKGEVAPYNGGMFTENTRKVYSLGYSFPRLKDYIYELIKFYGLSIL